MKTRLLLIIALAVQAMFTFAQLPAVTAGNYSRCDTCFVFSAHPDTINGNFPLYTYQWIFTGASPATDTGQTVTYCSSFAAFPYADSLNLTITDGIGQHQYYFNTLTSLMPDLGINTTVQQICIISVDTAVNKNMIVWDQTTDPYISSYHLYKETTTTGVYSLLKSIPCGTFSIFTDTSSQPDVKSARYRMTTLDSCGSESLPGTSHKTMHLTINSGIPPAWNLVWENYEGISFLKYRIWRKSIDSGWQLIDSVSASSTTYSDLTPPDGLLDYAIEILSPDICSPSLKSQNAFTRYNSSWSNVATNVISMISENTPLATIDVHPNPFHTSATIHISIAPKEADLVICNLYGQKIKTINWVMEEEININRGNLSAGIYFVRLVRANDVIATGKFVITDSRDD